jgi:uncharacterized membrane-anchored protein
MPAAPRVSLFSPLQYWRTILLVLTVGFLIATLFRDAIAVLLSTLVCAFVFSAYERRRWIVMPSELQAADIALRVALAFAFTYVLCSPHTSHALRTIARL